MVSAGEVGAADGGLEEGVAGDDPAFLGAVEGDAAGGVAGHGYDLYRKVANREGLSVGEFIPFFGLMERVGGEAE